MSQTDLPLFGAYNGTFGSVPTETSMAREEHERESGLASQRARDVLEVLEHYPHGLTWRQLGSILGLHHGQISGALSNLHRQGRVFVIREKRQGCFPYCHIKHLEAATEIHEVALVPVETKSAARRKRLETAQIMIQRFQNDPTVSDAEFRHIAGDWLTWANTEPGGGES